MGYTPVHDSQERFSEKRESHDVFFLVLFVAHLMAVIVVLVQSTTSSHEGEDDLIADDDHTFWIYVAVISCGLVLSIVIAMFYIRLLRTLAWVMVLVSFLVTIGVLVAGAAVAFGDGRMGLGITLAMLAGLTIVYFFAIRKNISFTVVLLNAAADVIRDHPATLYACFFITFLQIPWFILWGVAVYYSLANIEQSQVAPYIIFLVFSFYWTHEVSKNVVHTTVAGLFARWYFLSNEEMPPNPTLKSFKEAVTHAFGSICLGSLLIAITNTIRDTIYKVKEDGDNCCQKCIGCCFSCLSWIVDYFNSYTLVQVAIYGGSFCQSAREVSHMLKTTGVNAMINDSIVTHLMFMGSVAIGLLAGFLGGIIASADGEDWADNAVIAAIVGYIICALATEVVESGVQTIFVCFAENPGQLEKSHPELYHKLVQYYPTLTPGQEL